MSASSSSDDNDSVERREKRISTEYRVSSGLYLATAGYLATAPFFAPTAAAYAAVGPIMASAVAYILGGAAEHHRLGSNTYKRLNLFLAYFSICGLVSFFLLAGPKQVPFALPYLFGLKPSLTGWFYGVRGVDNKGKEASLFGELFQGTKSSLKGIISFGNSNAAVYLVATLFVLALKVAKMIDLVSVIQVGEPALVIAGRIFRYAKLSMLTGIVFTVKDAADRGRLEGTTFIQLNFLSSLVFGTLVVYLMGEEGEITSLAGVAAFFTAFCAYNGAQSTMKNRREKKA